MTVRIPAPPLLLITDRQSATREIGAVVADALAAGCRWVMIREKDLDTDALAALARPIVTTAHAAGAIVVVNGDPAAARAAGADGVHLPADADVGAVRREKGGGSMMIGLSAHSIGEARRAGSVGADYVTLSPVFLTDSKPGYGPALGLAGLKAAAAVIDLPVVALAGIHPFNAADCLRAGAAGIAVMGNIMRAPDTRAAVRAVVAAMSRA